MASVREVIEGLRILSKYAKPMPSGKEGLDVQVGGADHDVICGPYVGEDCEMDAADTDLLSEYGWHYDEEYDGWIRFC